MAHQVLAGAQQITITPPVGVDLCGFGGRESPSQGVHDELNAAALYLTDGSRQVIIITADLIGLHHDQVARVRAGIRERSGVDGQGVMIACSHTHAGPATPCLNYLGKCDEEYLAQLERRLIGLGTAAAAKAQPARVAWRRQPVSVGVNRRESREGHIVLGVDEDGPTTAYVDALYVDDLDGAPLARAMCHAAHGVTLGGDNLLISGDWPGYAHRELERLCGGSCVPLFLQGCCGDINSHPRGDFEVARRQGQTLAAAVLQADGAALRTSDARIDACSVPLCLPLADPPPLEEALQVQEQCRLDVDRARESGNYGVRMMAEGVAQWAAEVVRLARSGERGRTVPFEVQAIRVGGLALVGLPGEVFVDYAISIDAASPHALTSTAAYTNGNVGYIPTASAYTQGGYEVEGAIRFYGTTMPVPDSERLILAAAAEALDAVAD